MKQRLRCGPLLPDGTALATTDELRVHVAGGLPGEEVDVAIEHVSPHKLAGVRQAWGRAVDVVLPSAFRTAPVCPAYGSCGGCVLQHLAYAEQLRWKREWVAQALAPLGDGGPLVGPCVPSPRALGYRNQTKFVVGKDAARALILGAYAPRSHEVVDMAGCRLIEPVLDEVAVVVRTALNEANVLRFDERTRTGQLRYVAARSNAAGRVLVTLVTAKAGWREGEALGRTIAARHAGVSGVVQNVNPSAGNVIFGSEEHLLAGEPTLRDRVGDVEVQLSSRAFFQLNRDVAALAYADIAAWLSGARLVADVYSGVGGISFSLARTANAIVGIEENPAATAAASVMAREAGVRHVRFVTSDAAAAVSDLDGADAIVLNPPRAGCSPTLLAAVIERKPARIAYLSCDPTTLSRDLKMVVRAGFRLQAVTPFDMLPHTGHVETLALLDA